MLKAFMYEERMLVNTPAPFSLVVALQDTLQSIPSNTIVLDYTLAPVVTKRLVVLAFHITPWEIKAFRPEIT